jgi:hypothetical protein
MADIYREHARPGIPRLRKTRWRLRLARVGYAEERRTGAGKSRATRPGNHGPRSREITGHAAGKCRAIRPGNAVPRGRGSPESRGEADSRPPMPARPGSPSRPGSPVRPGSPRRIGRIAGPSAEGPHHWSRGTWTIGPAEPGRSRAGPSRFRPRLAPARDAGARPSRCPCALSGIRAFSHRLGDFE